jgi:hypothetical protein
MSTRPRGRKGGKGSKPAAEQNYEELLSGRDIDEQVEVLRPLLDRGMKMLDASRLYIRCNEDIELAVLAYHLARFANSMARMYPSYLWNAREVSPLVLVSRLDLLRRTLDLLDRLLTTQATSAPYCELTDPRGVRERVVMDTMGLVVNERLPRMSGFGSGVLGDGVDDLIAVAEQDSAEQAKRRKGPRINPWQKVYDLEQLVSRYMREAQLEIHGEVADSYPSMEQLKDGIIERISIKDLLEVEYYMMGYGPVVLWRTFFRLREEPVPGIREELLSGEDQVVNREKRRKTEIGA